MIRSYCEGGPGVEQDVRFTECPREHLGPHRGWVTERGGGVSPAPFATLNLGSKVGDDPANVAENERRVLRALGLATPARADLVHGTRVAVVETAGRVAATDALVTRQRGLPLALTVADCFPLAIVAGPWRALAHCGWRGVAGGIVEATLSTLRAEGAPLEAARAWIGPGIGVCCFEVGPEVASAFAAPFVRATPGCRPHLDLGSDIAERLRRAGVADRAILRAALCTSCRTDVCFSHRAEGPTGRMSAYLA